ncbi:MAG: hypothetical protein KDK39_10880 [Leptospiraceae bacterium]|nr:hypothetical protein [Leptospiraceae bacterium]
MSTGVMTKKTTKKQSPQQAPAKQDIKAFQKRLQQGLQELEQQYQELMQSLEQNRQNRVEIEVEGQQIQKRIRWIAGRLAKFSPYAARQMAYLQKLKAFQARNEELMIMISERLQLIETDALPEQSDVADLKADLLGMLGELSQMRRKREELLASIQKAV